MLGMPEFKILPKRLLKVILFIFSVCFVGCGAISIIFGAMYIVRTEPFRSIKEVSKDLQTGFIAWGVISLGILMFIVAILGFVAIITEEKYLSVSFAISLVICVALSIVLCVSAFSSENKMFDGSVRSRLEKVWTRKDESRFEINLHEVQGETVNFIQSTFKCCGIDGPDDYKNSTIPSTCCPRTPKECKYEDAYKSGCQKSLQITLSRYADYVKYAPIFVLIAEIAATIFAICYSIILFGYTNQAMAANMTPPLF